MMLIIIKLPHKFECNGSVQLSPFHRWEHIYVRMLQGIYGNRISMVYALTKRKNTMIVIKGMITYDEIKGCMNILKKKVPSNRIVNSEVEIINNELVCLEKLYNQNVGRCEEGNVLPKDRMLEFRKKAYDWDNVLIDMQAEKEQVWIRIDKKSTQALIARIRENMMERIDGNTDYRKIRGNAVFVIYRFKDDKLQIPKNIWRKMLENLDAVDGYLIQKIRNHMALSFINWPSWEEGKEFTGLQIFTFLKEKNIEVFYQMISEWILKFMKEQSVDQNVIEEILEKCQIGIMDLDDELKLKRMPTIEKKIWR